MYLRIYVIMWNERHNGQNSIMFHKPFKPNGIWTWAFCWDCISNEWSLLKLIQIHVKSQTFVHCFEAYLLTQISSEINAFIQNVQNGIQLNFVYSLHNYTLRLSIAIYKGIVFIACFAIKQMKCLVYDAFS